MRMSKHAIRLANSLPHILCCAFEHGEWALLAAEPGLAVEKRLTQNRENIQIYATHTHSPRAMHTSAIGRHERKMGHWDELDTRDVLISLLTFWCCRRRAAQVSALRQLCSRHSQIRNMSRMRESPVTNESGCDTHLFQKSFSLAVRFDRLPLTLRTFLDATDAQLVRRPFVMPNHDEIHFKSQKDCNVALRLPATYPVPTATVSDVCSYSICATVCVCLFGVMAFLSHQAFAMLFAFATATQSEEDFFFIETHLCSPPAARILSFLMLISFFSLSFLFSIIIFLLLPPFAMRCCAVLPPHFWAIIKFYALPSIHSLHTLHVYPDIALRSKFLLRFG